MNTDPTTLATARLVLPGIGDAAPSSTVESLDGEVVALDTLWQVASCGLALVLLRHYGCPFCKAHAQAIETRAQDFRDLGLEIALVGCGDLDEARRFAVEQRITVPLYNDPHRLAYQAYGVGEASATSILNPKVLLGGARAATRGFLPKRSSGNPLQLQGQFLIDRDGLIRSISRPALMSDIPSVESLLIAAQALQVQP